MLLFKLYKDSNLNNRSKLVLKIIVKNKTSKTKVPRLIIIKFQYTFSLVFG